MHVTSHENETYRAFVNDVANELGIFAYAPNDIVWHYTNASGFLGIIQSSSLFATQVACLNDTTETKYATDLFKQAVSELASERAEDPAAVAFFTEVQEIIKDPPDSPTNGTSKFFVACFSGDDDELTQWDRYSKPNGYAIGFYARGLFRDPTSRLYKVVYDREKQLTAAKKLAGATWDFYLQGLTAERQENPKEWARVFFLAWDEWIYKLAPLAKDKSWSSENEYRLVHELKVGEFPDVCFSQKNDLLTRYLALTTPSWVKTRSGRLPIAKVRVGPGNQDPYNKIGVRLLLEQMGYTDVSIESTKCTVRW